MQPEEFSVGSRSGNEEKCQSCQSSFRPTCADQDKTIEDVPLGLICGDCKEIEHFKKSNINKFGFERIEQGKLNKMLAIVVAIMEQRFEKSTKDFNQIKAKIDAQRYEVSQELLLDCKKSNNPKICDAMRDVIDDLEQCQKCFERYYETGKYMVEVCNDRPHLLVWAKTKTDPYWPAKLYSSRENDSSFVAFFGRTNPTAIIENEKLLLLSEEYPGKEMHARNKKKKQAQDNFNISMEELNQHINKLKQTVGFEYATTHQQFIKRDMELQIKQMFPGSKPQEDKEPEKASKKCEMSEQIPMNADQSQEDIVFQEISIASEDFPLQTDDYIEDMIPSPMSMEFEFSDTESVASEKVEDIQPGSTIPDSALPVQDETKKNPLTKVLELLDENGAELRKAKENIAKLKENFEDTVDVFDRDNQKKEHDKTVKRLEDQFGLSMIERIEKMKNLLLQDKNNQHLVHSFGILKNVVGDIQNKKN